MPVMTGSELAPYDPAKYRRDEARVARGFWTKVRRYGRSVPFLPEALAGYYCARDPRTPLKAKAVLMGALAYFVLPADMLPDFVALLGFTDDATVLYAAIRSIAPHITGEHRAKARAAIERITAEQDAPETLRPSA